MNPRRDISITFAHFHHELHDYDQWFIRVLETAGWNPRIAHDSLRPDLFIGSYYWRFNYPLEEYQAGRKVFWSEEPIASIKAHMWPKAGFHDYDVVLYPGISTGWPGDVNVHSYPSWPIVCIDWWKRPLDFQGILDTPEMLCRRDQYEFPKTKGTSFVATQGNRSRCREVRAVMRDSPIDCPGPCMHNCDDEALTNRKLIGRWAGKIEHLRAYRANIALENRIGWYYCTEKVMQPLMTRTVPVVYHKNTTPEIRREALILHGAPSTTATALNDSPLLERMSAEPVFDNPEQIRELYGPHTVAEIITGEKN